MPSGSMKKFFADRSDGRGSEIHWPGTADGFPFRGPVPDLKDTEFTETPLAMDYHSQRFCLWDAAEHAAFNEVMERIVNGLYMQHKRMDRWSDTHGGMLVWLEWVQIYGELPVVNTPGATNAYQYPNAAQPG